MATTSVAKRETTTTLSPLQRLRHDVESITDQLQIALQGSGIPVDKFKRVFFTAVQSKPEIQKCSPGSVIRSCLQAAADGLKPDGKDGSIIAYGDEAQWSPMIGGLRKKIRQSGEISDFNAQVVFEGDEFDFQMGDDAFIHHRPASRGGRKRAVTHAYSIAKFKDGTVSREVLNIDQIMDIASKSRAKKGPWHDPVFFPEMCRKTVARLHSKQLPMTGDTEAVFRRNDDLYDLADQPHRPERRLPPPGSARAVLDQFAAGSGAEPERVEQSPPIQQQDQPQPEPPPHGEPASDAEPPPHGEPAPRQQAEAQPAQPQAAAPPKTEPEYVVFADAIIEAADDAKTLHEWWNSPAQRRLRNACQVVRETFDALAAKIKTRSEELESAS